MSDTAAESKPVRIIQVGVGGWGRRWLRTMQQFATRAPLVAIVDINDDAVSAARELLGRKDLPAFGRIEDAIAAVEADAVLCVVTPMYHEAVILPALEAGLHVLSEKPIADTLESCHRIVRAARKSRGRMMVAQKARYHPWVRRFRQAIESNELGTLSHVEHNYRDGRIGYPSWGKFRHEIPDALMVEQGIHYFDMLRALMGREPVSVWAQTWNPPWSSFKGDIVGFARFQFEGDLPVFHHSNKISRGSLTSWYGEIVAEAEHGTISMIWPHLSITRPGATPNQLLGPRQDLMLVTDPEHGHDAGFVEFLDSIAQNRPGESSVEDNLKSMAMVFAAIDSSHEHVERRIADYLV